jgi:hypothetical protein
MIHKNGNMVSNHTTKQAATNAARRKASQGDTIQVHYQDGRIQERYSYSGDRDRDQQGQPGSGARDGSGTFETGVSDFFK